MLTLIESNMQNKLQRENCLGAETGNLFVLNLYMFTRNKVNKKFVVITQWLNTIIHSLNTLNFEQNM